MAGLSVFDGKFQWVRPQIPTGNITSRDTPNGRIYTDESGTEYWSMTTMLGMTEDDHDWYEKWVERVGLEYAEQESTRCCDRGEKIHLASEMYVRNYPFEECVEAAGEYRRLFIQLKRALDTGLGKVYGAELPVFSKIMKVGGRLDLCAEWKGELALIDYKGSNFIKTRSDTTSYRHQLCGYSLAIEEMHSIKAKKLINIIANEKSPMPTIIITDRKDVIKEFAERIKKFHKIINC
jgi:hypothetical protein